MVRDVGIVLSARPARIGLSPRGCYRIWLQSCRRQARIRGL
jgi:hypothetical protein